MENAIDVAAYIVQQYFILKHESIDTLKLQKLLYYSQAWNLVWFDAPLFRERIEAWRNGPVVREVYEAHKGEFSVQVVPEGSPNGIDPYSSIVVDKIIDFYGKHSGHYLSELTHFEDPWKEARKGLSPSEPSNNEISHDSMRRYYSNLAYGAEDGQQG